MCVMGASLPSPVNPGKSVFHVLEGVYVELSADHAARPKLFPHPIPVRCALAERGTCRFLKVGTCLMQRGKRRIERAARLLAAEGSDAMAPAIDKQGPHHAVYTLNDTSGSCQVTFLSAVAQTSTIWSFLQPSFQVRVSAAGLARFATQLLAHATPHRYFSIPFVES